MKNDPILQMLEQAVPKEDRVIVEKWKEEATNRAFREYRKNPKRLEGDALDRAMAEADKSMKEALNERPF